MCPSICGNYTRRYALDCRHNTKEWALTKVLSLQCQFVYDHHCKKKRVVNFCLVPQRILEFTSEVSCEALSPKEWST